MPWGEKTVKEIRQDFVTEVLSGERPKSQICREYSISRVTGDKWLKRYLDGETLENQSRAPFRTPNKTDGTIEKALLDVRRAHPSWGARKLRKFLENKGALELPAFSTVCEILKRNGFVSKKASQAATKTKRFQRDAPNDLWQTDFKGHFAMQNGQRCHPLTVLDDHSRFSLCIDAKDNERSEGVLSSFTRLFLDNGLPKSLLCDNGNPWGTSQSTGHTKFELWLMDLGILPIHGRPLHPQTQGKEERFHRTMEDDLLKL